MYIVEGEQVVTDYRQERMITSCALDYWNHTLGGRHTHIHILLHSVAKSSFLCTFCSSAFLFHIFPYPQRPYNHVTPFEGKSVSLFESLQLPLVSYCLFDADDARKSHTKSHASTPETCKMFIYMQDQANSQLELRTMVIYFPRN